MATVGAHHQPNNKTALKMGRSWCFPFDERFWPKIDIRGARGIGLPPNNGLQSDAPPAARDAGGNCFPVKKATDAGLVDGPRIYPAGPYIGQTSGHGDFRGPNDVPENPGTPLDYTQRVGHTLIADGVPDVIKRSREILRMGASQIKAMAGGGVASFSDPLDVAQYSLEELQVIVEEADNWKTYVTVHA